jgi:AraC-like DNA-binding protein/quercetin dioxygenase-like cupin family protein
MNAALRVLRPQENTARMSVKARIEKILPPSAASFVYQFKREPSFGVYWHYHPEYQLTLVLRGHGKRFVGDDVSPFKAGDLVLTGPNLPHMWCSTRTRDRGGRPHEAIIIQFPGSIFGGQFLELPEMTPVRRLLDRSAQGIRFGDGARKKISRRMVRMGRQRGLARLIELLEILRILSQAPAERTLSSRAFSPAVRLEDRDRIDGICRYAAENSTRPLALSQAASAAHMSVPAFTRFFRKSTGKTYVEFLTEIRVGSACRLLVESDKTVTEVCFAAGFNNVSTFNRRFMELKGVTPREFRRQFSP